MPDRRTKLIEGVMPYLDEGETPRYIVSGQTGAPQGPLGSPERVRKLYPRSATCGPFGAM